MVATDLRNRRTRINGGRVRQQVEVVAGQVAKPRVAVQEIVIDPGRLRFAEEIRVGVGDDDVVADLVAAGQLIVRDTDAGTTIATDGVVVDPLRCRQQ